MDRESVRDEALEKAREELSEQASSDLLVIKAVKQLEQIEEGLDRTLESFREWYSVHFPELEEAINNDKQFIDIIADEPNKENLESFNSLAEDSTGRELREKDLDILENVAKDIQNYYSSKERIENYIDDLTSEDMPNLSEILGPVLTAKLLALSGGLEDIAKSPASTIQVLGAEKALFRYLSGEGSSPKHGVLFEHEYVGSLPENERGKMARFIANKCVIAARLDFYGEKDKSEKFREEVRQKYLELEDN